MWQTDAHRLIRDLHRRQILNLLRHHKKEDVSAAKTRRMTFGSIASRLFQVATQKSFNGMNDDQHLLAGPPSASHEYPGESIAARQTTPIDRLQWNVACWFSA